METDWGSQQVEVALVAGGQMMHLCPCFRGLLNSHV